MSLQPLSQTQRYFLRVMVNEGFDPSWQHVVLATRLQAALDPERVRDVAGRIDERHPILGARLAYRDGEAFLARSDRPHAAVVVIDAEGAGDDELDLRVAREADRPFDLLAGPLWRLVVASSSPRRSVLLFVCHHLVGDGMSSWILAKDFGALYFGGALDPVAPSYERFVHEELEMLDGRVGDERMAYWERLLDGAQPLLLGVPRPAFDEVGSRDTLGLAFASGAAESLVANSRARRVTPLTLLATAAISAVKSATHEQDVLAATVTDIRGPRYAGTVGTFSDLMFVRDLPDRDDDTPARLGHMRNALFSGWQSHLPVAHICRHLPCFAASDMTAANPCDVFLNFIPVRGSSDWFALIELYREAAPEFYAMQQRIGSPSRRFNPPLFFFSFVHAMELTGWVNVHRTDALDALNHAVAEDLQQSAVFSPDLSPDWFARRQISG